VQLLLPIGLGLAAACFAADPNKFIVNGRAVELTDEQLAQLRRSWGINLRLQTVLPRQEAQWVLDFIALLEGGPPEPCAKLELVSTEQLKGKQDLVEGKVIRAGRFDELWSISACGRAKRYRVLNRQGTRELQVYEVRNPAF
jgi:hypothetical protein